MPMKSPDYVRVMRTAAWIWIIYLICQGTVDLFIYAKVLSTSILAYHFFNTLPALVFLGLAYSKWSRSGNRTVIALMILLVSAVPILINHVLGLRLPPAPLANLEGMILRQLPVLFISLVLVAWHYNLTWMVLYCIATNILELGLVFLVDRLNANSLTAFYAISIIRTVCFIVVGVFINLLIAYLRAEHESLLAANNQLTHYASTLENLTISRERNRMSRELHDTVVHTLSGLSVQLETAKAYWDVNPETARGLIDQSLESTRSGLKETRRAIRALRASPLDDLGLVKAIQALLDSVSQRSPLTVSASLPKREPNLSPDVAQCFYRIAQESIENAFHHAVAKHLNVHLAQNGDTLALIIEDDGIGFSPENAVPAGHFGLNGMRERAAMAGASLTVSSHPNRGTRISLLLKGITP